MEGSGQITSGWFIPERRSDTWRCIEGWEVTGTAGKKREILFLEEFERNFPVFQFIP